MVRSNPAVAMIIPGRAVTALEGFGLEKRLLNGVEAVAVRERLDGRDSLGADARDAGDARACAERRREHGARAALPFAASEATPGQRKVVTQDRQQVVVRLGINLPISTVDAQHISSHARILATGIGYAVIRYQRSGTTDSDSACRIPHTVEISSLFPEGG